MLSRALDQLMRPFGITAPALALTDIQLDSRRVVPGCLFVAIRGHQVDGRRFIEQAVAQERPPYCLKRMVNSWHRR